MSQWHVILGEKGLKSVEISPDYKSKYFRAVATMTTKDDTSVNVELNSPEHTHEFIVMIETLQIKELAIPKDDVVQVVVKE